jgi:hypothetical protein
MLHTSAHFRVIHRRFIACCYRRGCPAVTLCKPESRTTAAGFILRKAKRRQANYKLEVVGAKGEAVAETPYRSCDLGTPSTGVSYPSRLASLAPPQALRCAAAVV